MQVPYDQVEISNSPTLAGTKTILSGYPATIIPSNADTVANDTINTSGFYFARWVNSSATTFTISGATLTSAAHGLSNGQTIRLTAVTTMPTGLTTPALYYVVGATTNTFQVSLTAGGTAVSSSDSGSGTLNWYLCSTFSDGQPYAGYGILTARSLIDNALMMINKEQNDTLSDEYGFMQINNCQMEVLREYKRWSFMQVYNKSLGLTSQGTWSVANPADLDDTFTNKSVYTFRIGTEPDMTWVDKEKWNEITQGVAHTTLAAAINLNDVTITLTNSGDFPDAGSVYIGANTYSYSANNRTTNVLTITASATTNSNGADVFNIAGGSPLYWTEIAGNLTHFPPVSSSLKNRNYYLDYYKAPISIVNDTDVIVLPDPTIVQYYVAWKFLLKQNSGKEDEASKGFFNSYQARMTKFKQKEVLGRTFKLLPRKNDWSRQMSGADDVNSKRIKLSALRNI